MEKNLGCAGFVFDELEGVEQDGVADGWRGFQSVRLTDGLIKAKCVSCLLSLRSRCNMHHE